MTVGEGSKWYIGMCSEFKDNRSRGTMIRNFTKSLTLYIYIYIGMYVYMYIVSGAC